MKRYSISHLLSKQPKSIQKHPYYRQMLHHVQLSPKLQKLRFSRRCYSLLLHAKIAPENLKHFYRTYRLPKDPFFPLYFAVKRDYLATKERRKQEKRKYIADQMRRLPPDILSFLQFLARLEQHCNYGNHYPLWSEHLFPKTKKQVRAYHCYSEADWISCFQSFLTRLRQRYRSFPAASAEQLYAGFLLDCLPDLPKPRRHSTFIPGGFARPSADTVIKQYRRASKHCHPDRGGDPEMFVRIQWARDVLLC